MAHLFGPKHHHPVLASRLALEPAGVELTAHDLLPRLHRIMGHGCRASEAGAAPILLVEVKRGA